MGRWMPETDWQLLWGLIKQESAFNPNAESPVGARGLTQFMPGTWSDVTRRLGLRDVHPTMARPAIDAGAFYLEQLRRNWSSPRPESDRLKLALASYNAGLGNLLKAQRHCLMPVLYPAIARCLPEITGHHAKETLHYVPAVWRYYLNKKLRVRM